MENIIDFKLLYLDGWMDGWMDGLMVGRVDDMVEVGYYDGC